MEDIAALAGLTKRTLYNNYPDKTALFVQIAADAIAYAERFARDCTRSSRWGSPPRTCGQRSTTWKRLALGVARPSASRCDDS
jgi:AcrR family transcriptional regulator